ncbi:MAG: multicopper oxidase family protein, partial [Myxococcales bacterium]
APEEEPAAQVRGSEAGMSRREVLATTGAVLAGGSALLSLPASAAPTPAPRARPGEAAVRPPAHPGRDYDPVVVPNGAKLPWRIVEGVKVFHLIPEPVDHEFAPGLKVRCWGYNGTVHGPLLEAVEGERVRIYVTNRLPAPTTVHWHGMLVPSGMDGVGGISQRAIHPGETFKYEFTLKGHGTFMYHSHHDEMVQMALGMAGLFVVHPRVRTRRVDRDFAILLHEWRIDPDTMRPDPFEMIEFNVLTMNAKAFPATEPLVVRTGQRVRIRLGNLSATDHHPIHLHGFHFRVTETDAGPIPESAQWPETTVLVPVGSSRTIEFVADAPGDWALHCHMLHHMMNQMGHDAAKMIGVRTEGLDERIRALLPGYMSMGQTGM